MTSFSLRWSVPIVALAAAAALISYDGALAEQRTKQAAPAAPSRLDAAVRDNVERLLAEGIQTFRYDTFGSEDFWGGRVKLHQAIQGEKFGGVGPGLSPKPALEFGLKVDMEAVPKNVATAIKTGKVDLNDPANTLLLLKANAVLGVTGFFNEDGKSLKSVGIQCALCHSTVNNAFMPGIGRRLDGWPNRDLNIGAIVASAPDLRAFAEMLEVDEATVKKVLTSWGPGKFDAQLNLDGKAFRPDGKPAATLNPSAFGLAGVNNHTWTGAWGTVTYWNAYVGNLEMHGKGNSMIRASITRRSIRSRRAPGKATRMTAKTGSRRSCRRCIFINCRYRVPNRRPALSMPQQPRAARSCSPGRQDAPVATCCCCVL